jgi:hypothetical protein
MNLHVLLSSFLHTYILLDIEVHISVAAQQALFSEIVWEPFPNMEHNQTY